MYRIFQNAELIRRPRAGFSHFRILVFKISSLETGSFPTTVCCNHSDAGSWIMFLLNNYSFFKAQGCRELERFLFSLDYHAASWMYVVNHISLNNTLLLAIMRMPRAGFLLFHSYILSTSFTFCIEAMLPHPALRVEHEYTCSCSLSGCFLQLVSNYTTAPPPGPRVSTSAAAVEMISLSMRRQPPGTIRPWTTRHSSFSASTVMGCPPSSSAGTNLKQLAPIRFIILYFRIQSM